PIHKKGWRYRNGHTKPVLGKYLCRFPAPNVIFRLYLCASENNTPINYSRISMAEKITMQNGQLQVPDHPVIPFIEGDGIGPEIWQVAQKVFDAAVAKVYQGNRKIEWKEMLAGEKAFRQTGNWLPAETLQTARAYIVSIKGPLTTPIGGGIRSLNVAMRQDLDLYVCLRPVRWFKGVPS